MDHLATVLLRRTAELHIPQPVAGTIDEAWVTTVEADLAERGWVLDPAVRAVLGALPAAERTRWADWLCAVADEMVGADRAHVPLFRRFPNVPAEPTRLFIDRLLVHLFQADGAPCVLCGADGSVQALSCGHLVCAVCFDAGDYSACPVCGRRIDATDTWLALTAPPNNNRHSTPLRLRRITLGGSLIDAARAERDRLVARPGALSPADVADLGVLIAATDPTTIAWLPDDVPSRETLAHVCATVLHHSVLTDTWPDTVTAVAARWGTATDVLRSLWVYSGGDAGLVVPAKTPTAPTSPRRFGRPVDEPQLTVEVQRVRALPRGLRRAVLDRLEKFDCATAAEDMGRHPTLWKRVAERLHPFEKVSATPSAAVAFAALRDTRAPANGQLAAAIRAECAANPDHLTLIEHADGTVSVRARSFAALVEERINERDLPGAISLLTGRPGELWRRVDHLARLAELDDPAVAPIVHAALINAATHTAKTVSAGVLAAASAALVGRDATVQATERLHKTVVRRHIERTAGGRSTTVTETTRTVPVAPAPGTPRRVFFPKGSVTRTWTEPENRPPIPAAFVDELRAVVDRELTSRAGDLDRFDVAVIDAALATVPAPVAERSSSAQLEGWPRGSVRTLPDDNVVRLFLHWADAVDGRTDLDLSCMFFDGSWQPLGWCDYTNLRFPGAIHSGDLTSAPAPLGATEYLDLDRNQLVRGGVRFAAPIVFSYNDVPFDLLDEAFAGFMAPEDRNAQFDGARVQQRFDLRGDTRSLMPMILDVVTGDVMWADVSLTGSGYGHAVAGNQNRIGGLAADLWEHFAEGARPTQFDVAAWHAVARADTILVRHPDGATTTVATSDPAVTLAAARAAATAGSGDGRGVDIEGRRVFAAIVDAASLPSGSPAAGSLAVCVTGRPPAPWLAASVGDLAAGLVPRGS